MNLTCESVRRELPLLIYGELSFDEEENVQRHIDGCEGCARSLEAERAMHAALDDFETPVPEGLLVSARRGLRRALAEEMDRASRPSLWRRFWNAPYLKPAGAFAAVALAFFGGRMTNPVAEKSDFDTENIRPLASRVRYVEPSPTGDGVQIVLDETRQRIVSGSLEDRSIKQLLLAAAKDPNDPGLRVESVEMLCSRSGEAEVRDALLYALEHDSNPGVRLKALDGLKTYSKDSETRAVLARVLLKDTNAGVRAQAIDVLTQSRNKDIVAPLQELLRKEDNDYVRMRTQNALREMKASPGIF
jgi:plasmid stability protein